MTVTNVDMKENGLPKEEQSAANCRVWALPHRIPRRQWGWYLGMSASTRMFLGSGTVTLKKLIAMVGLEQPSCKRFKMQSHKSSR
jgi:hypothetical protein